MKAPSATKLKTAANNSNSRTNLKKNTIIPLTKKKKPSLKFLMKARQNWRKISMTTTPLTNTSRPIAGGEKFGTPIEKGVVLTEDFLEKNEELF